MPEVERSWRLEIPSDTSRLADVRDFVACIARESGFAEEDVYKIEMAVDEACANIIEHAYRGEKKGRAARIALEFRVIRDGDRLEIVITDRGIGFDFDSVKPVDLKSHIRQRRSRGLGVHLIRTFMDEVEYRTVEDAGNQLRLIKYIRDEWR
ncbi:MAG: ATP-binding protein [bacterium]